MIEKLEIEARKEFFESTYKNKYMFLLDLQTQKEWWSTDSGCKMLNDTHGSEKANKMMIDNIRNIAQTEAELEFIRTKFI